MNQICSEWIPVFKKKKISFLHFSYWYPNNFWCRYWGCLLWKTIHSCTQDFLISKFYWRDNFVWLKASVCVWGGAEVGGRYTNRFPGRICWPQGRWPPSPVPDPSCCPLTQWRCLDWPGSARLLASLSRHCRSLDCQNIPKFVSIF